MVDQLPLVALVAMLLGILAYVRETDAPSPTSPRGEFWTIVAFATSITLIVAVLIGLWRGIRTRE